MRNCFLRIMRNGDSVILYDYGLFAVMFNRTQGMWEGNITYTQKKCHKTFNALSSMDFSLLVNVKATKKNPIRK